MSIRSYASRVHVDVCRVFATALLIGCGQGSGNDGATGGSIAIGGSSPGQFGGSAAMQGGSSGSSAGGSGLDHAQSGGMAQQGGESTGAAGAGTGGANTSSHQGGVSSAGTATTAGTAIPAGGRSATTGGTRGLGGMSAGTGGRSITAGGTLGTGGGDMGGRSGTSGGAGTTGNAGAAAGGVAASGGTGGIGTGGSGAGGTGTAGASSSTSSTEVSIIPDPSWNCGMPNGIPVPILGELVFHAVLEIDKTHDVGATPFGDRRLLTIKGGTLEGKNVKATLLTGGMELELTLSNGAVELEEINVLKASDGTLIYMRTCGMAPAGDAAVRIVPDFEVATSKSLSWLNTGKYAGTRTLDAAAGKIQLDVYDISKLAVAEPKVQLKDPAGVANQPWECSTLTGTRGSTVFTESVTLGSSLSVGSSKNGNRNIIPITGGTVTGGALMSSLSGTVLPAGADYQLIGGSSAKLDARYALATKDGEYIVVRNCGPMGALIPTFETRAAGPYAILNTNKYLSGDPGSASGGVSITFYERK